MADELNLMDAAIELRIELPDLVGPGWESMDRDLGHLIAQAETGQDVGLEMVELFATNEDVRVRMVSIFGDEPSVVLRGLGFRPLPGHPVQPPRGTRHFCCPNSECDYCWVQHKPGQPVPNCPEHDLLLVEH